MESNKNSDAEILDIISMHLHRYPQMQEQDFVKLLYQNEFGCGHLVKNERTSLEFLKQEYNTIVPQSSYSPLIEDIGNGLVRVYLHAIPDTISIEQLNNIFVASAQLHGSLDNFIAKLNLLKNTIHRFNVSFSHAALTQFLRNYADANYPIISHSALYRSIYKPAYRVVLKHLLPKNQ